MKTCTKCKLKKSKRVFFRDIQKSDGLTSQCRDCIRKQRIQTYSNNREKALAYSKKHYSENKEHKIKLQNIRRKKIITEIFELLGNKCKECGFENKIALQIDHLNGGGYKHRKISGGGMNYYNQIKNNITKFQLLCANCNFIEGVKKNYRKSIWN